MTRSSINTKRACRSTRSFLRQQGLFLSVPSSSQHTYQPMHTCPWLTVLTILPIMAYRAYAAYCAHECSSLVLFLRADFQVYVRYRGLLLRVLVPASSVRACSKVRYDAMCCGAMACGPMRCGMVRYNAVRCCVVRCGAARWDAVRCCAVRFGAVRCDVVAYSLISASGSVFVACRRGNNDNVWFSGTADDGPQSQK